MINYDEIATKIHEKHDRSIEKLGIAADISKKMERLVPRCWYVSFNLDTETLDFISTTETETAVTEFKELCKHLSRITGKKATEKTKVGNDNSVYMAGKISIPNLVIEILQFKPERQCKIEYKEKTVLVPTATCMGSV